MFFVLCVPGILLLAAAVVDLRRMEIPDVVPVLLLVWAILATACGWLAHAWWEVPAGAAVGLLIGALSFRLGGMGGGDAKLLAGVGAVLGPLAFLMSFVFIAVCGGVLALVHRLRNRREHAYAPAIAAGYILFIVIVGAANGWF